MTKKSSSSRITTITNNNNNNNDNDNDDEDSPKNNDGSGQRQLPNEVIVHIASYINDRNAWNGTISLNKTIYEKTKDILPPWPDFFRMRLIGSTVQLFTMSPNMEWIVCGCIDGTIHFYHCRKGHASFSWEPDQKCHVSMMFSPTDPTKLVVMTPSRLWLWDLKGDMPIAKELRRPGGFSHTVNAVTFTVTREAVRFDISPDGKLVVLEVRSFFSPGLGELITELPAKRFYVFPLMDGTKLLLTWAFDLAGLVDVKFLPCESGRYRVATHSVSDSAFTPIIIWDIGPCDEVSEIEPSLTFVKLEVPHNYTRYGRDPFGFQRSCDKFVAPHAKRNSVQKYCWSIDGSLGEVKSFPVARHKVVPVHDTLYLSDTIAYACPYDENGSGEVNVALYGEDGAVFEGKGIWHASDDMFGLVIPREHRKVGTVTKQGHVRFHTLESKPPSTPGTPWVMKSEHGRDYTPKTLFRYNLRNTHI